MADRTIKPDDTNDLVLQNNHGGAKIEINEGGEITVTLGGSAGDDLNIDSNTLVVSSDTNRVGVGTNDPQEPMHIVQSASGFPLEVECSSGNFIGSKMTNTEGSWGFYTDAGEFNVYDVGTGVERMNFDSSGNVKINSGNVVIGTAGKGIDFSANSHASGMTSELLDSYETGTWTPVIKTGASAFATTITFTGGTQTFLYTKIGNLCHVMFAVDASTASAPTTPEIKIEGFPFTFKAGSAWYPGTPILINSLGLDLSADSIVAGSAGNSYAYVMSHAGSGYGFTDASDSGTSWMYFQLTYLME